MTFIERALRVMTRINIGASLGVAAWLMFASADLLAAHPAAGKQPDQFVQPVGHSECGCSTDIALAESVR